MDMKKQNHKLNPTGDAPPENMPNDKAPTNAETELEEAEESCSAEPTTPATPAPLCQFCSTAGVVLPAEVLCENCGYRYCYECLNTLHPRRGPFTTHRLQSVNRKCEVPVTVFLCPHHDEANPAQVQVYCVTCSSAVCLECTTIRGRHQNHFLRMFREQAAVKMEAVMKHVKELQKLESVANTDVTDMEKCLEQLRFQYQQETLKTQQTCASIHLKILSAETRTLETLKEGFLQAKKELEHTKGIRHEWLLSVQQEIQKFDKVLQLSQNDASPIVLTHEAKKAIQSRSETLIARKPALTGETFNTSSWTGLANAKLCILINNAINSVFNSKPAELSKEYSNNSKK